MHCRFDEANTPRKRIYKMKQFKVVFTAALLSCTLGIAADLESVLSDLAGNDYDARQEARNELYSMAAEATASDSASAFRADMSSTLLGALKAGKLDQQANVFLTRILARMAAVEAAADIFDIARDAGQSPVVREHAAMALSTIPGKAVTGMLLDGLVKSDAAGRTAWWQAIQHQLGAADVEDLVKVIKRADLNADPQSWSALGKIGGPAAADFLITLLDKVDGKQLTALETAILDTEGLSSRHLKNLLESSNDEEIKTGAFEQLLQADSKVALEVLKAALSGEPSALRQRMIRLALETGDDGYWSTIANATGDLAAEEIDTFLGCVKDQENTEYEDLVIKYLQTGVLNTRKEALRALAAVGTKRSTTALLERIDSEDEDISDLAIYALSQIKDPGLDEQILSAIKDSGSSNRGEMLRLVAVRNNDGATDLLNAILFEGADDPDLDEILNSIEAIGDVDSCRILLSRIILNPSRSILRTYQLSLKRLTIRLALDDFLWDNAFQPALELASNDSARAAIVEILDCLSSDKALEYCTTSLHAKQPEIVRQAASSALKRWTSINASDYWLDVLTDDDATDSDTREATAAILRLIKASSVDASSQEKAELAYDIIMEIDDADLTELLLTAVKDNRGLKSQFENILEPYQELLSKWEALD
jgi:HEAT repeat protein